MNAITMITSAVAYFAAAAVLAWLLSFHKTLSGWIAGIGWRRVGLSCSAGSPQRP